MFVACGTMMINGQCDMGMISVPKIKKGRVFFIYFIPAMSDKTHERHCFLEYILS